MKRLAHEAVAGQLAVNARSSPARAIERLEDENRAPLADAHAGTAAIERPARIRIHQAQRVEAAEGQTRQRIGAAGEHGVGPAAANRVGRLADRDRARRARGHQTRAQSLEAEPMRDGVRRRARKMIPHIRLARARDAGCHPRAVEGFVAEEIGRACAEHHAHTRAIEQAVEQPRIGQRLGCRRHADLIAARQAAALERREPAVQRARLHLGRKPAAVAFGVEQLRRARMPHSPATMRSHVDSRVLPRAVTMPMPGDDDRVVHHGTSST